MDKLILVGGGGHCKSVLDSVLKTNQYGDIGIVDTQKKDELMGMKIVGSDADLPELFNKGFTHAFVSLGNVGSPKNRIRLFKTLEEIGFIIPNIIDKTAIVSLYADFGRGIYVGKNAVLNSCCSIKDGAIVNTSAVIEHDCLIESFAHIAPGTVLCGNVSVKENAFIGARSVIKQQITIGKNVVIGMGSVVIKDIPDNVVAYGNPCKEVKKL